MLYIRTDMNTQIATGHLMRCLAIADGARVFGEDTTFLLADGQAVEMVGERGYYSVVLGTMWDDLDGELEKLEQVIYENGIKSLLIDSYQVTKDYLYILSKQVKIIYMDDLNRFLYPVHTLICYGDYWRKFHYKEKYPNTNLLLGSKYIPLRQEFKNQEKKRIKPQVENLLFLSGGTDHFHLLEGFLTKLEKEKYQKIQVICGRYYDEYEKLRSQYIGFDNIHFYKGVNHVERYMAEADLAVSAGGTTLYELCACGTPTISYSFADNQIDTVLQLQEDGRIDYAGDVRNTNIFENVMNLLNLYYADFRLREERSRKMQEFVDGNGAERIARELMKLSEKDYCEKLR